MKPLNQLELDFLVHDLNESLHKAQLQDCTSWEDGVILWHYRQGEQNLLIDLSMARPLFLIKAEDWKLAKRKTPFPIQLFINSHARNLYFDHARILEEWGRVVEIVYRNTEVTVRMELHLIPNQVNFSVEARGGALKHPKQIYFAKPRDLKPALDVDLASLEARSLVSLEKEWRESRFSQKISNFSTASAPISAATQAEKILNKKKKALQAIDEQLRGYNETFWLTLGEKVKVEGLSGLSPLEKESLKDCRHVGEAIQFSFQKAKQIQQKREGTLQRRRIVETEIEKLEKQMAEGRLPAALGAEKKSVQFKDKDSKSADKNLKLRKLELSSTVHAFIGKSALDNLSLLRQARAWDFWLHLKDYPGAYGIIRREKNENIPLDSLVQVARFVAKNSSAAQGLSVGDRVCVVYTECRHVRPVKGAKPGLVTYQKAQEIFVEI